jgi:hypothetical protein
MLEESIIPQLIGGKEMNKENATKDNIKQFTDQCFDRESEKAAGIIKGILDARSPRISDISNAMDGNPDANYKTIQRFIGHNEPKDALRRLYDEDSSFVLGDPTDIERLQASKTEYVGKLKDKQLGFQILVLATPYQGRAIPFSFVTYSSKTIGSEMRSRNMEHSKAIGELKELLGDKILVLDREFSYEWFFEELVEAGIQFVIRLKVGNNPTILNEEGEKISLTVGIGEQEHYQGVYYKGNVEVNLAGKWEKGFNEPMWVICSLNLKPPQALEVYGLRMKIDECFRDTKNLLDLDKIMNKKRVNMEKMVALTLLAYSIGLLIGEEIRERLYTGRKRKLFSGLFILLKRNDSIVKQIWEDIMNAVYSIFTRIVFGYVRTHV